MTPYFEYRHVVGLEETNLVGNVYYAHFVRWQGRCRELFLREHAPELLRELGADLKIFTLTCSCEYLAEVTAFDEISVRMRLAELTRTQVAFVFDYVRVADERPVARGEQRVVCMRADASGEARPAEVPEPLRRGLAPYAVARGGPTGRSARPAVRGPVPSPVA